MAIKGVWQQFGIYLHPTMRERLVARAEELGYDNLTMFVRCLFQREIQHRLMPPSRNVLGMKRRELAKRNIKRLTATERSEAEEEQPQTDARQQ